MEETTPRAEALLENLHWLRGLAKSLVRDPQLAEDAVQDTLVKALSHRPRSADSLRSWLGKVLRNEVRQEQRSRARRSDREARLERPEETRATADVVAELALQRRLVDLVQELKEPHRTAIAMRFLRGQRPRQIARELGVPVKTVHSRIERGLAQLRGRLDREFGGDRSAWVAVLAPWISRGGLGLGLGSLVIPMNVKLIAAALGVVALGALASLPLRSRSASTASTPAPPPVAAELPASQAARPNAPEPTLESGARRSSVPALGTAPEEVLAPATSFQGLAREMDGRPVAGLKIVFEVEERDAYRRATELAPVPTAGDGSFTFPLPELTGRLCVESERYTSIARPYLEGVLPAEPPVVVVAPRRAYAGRVVDEAGRPVENARVTVTLDGSWIQSHTVGDEPLHLLLPFGEMRTDAYGEFAFDDVGFVEGAHVEAERDGYTNAIQTLPEHAELELELVLTRGQQDAPAIHGRVVDANGSSVADAHVSLGWGSVQSAPDGAFVLPLEEWQKTGFVRAVKAGHMPTSVPFDRAEGTGLDPDQPMTLYLGERPLSIRGRVLDAEGLPAAGVTVWTPDTTHFGSVLFETGKDSTRGDVTVEELVSGASQVATMSWRTIGAVTDAKGRFELQGLLQRDYAIFALDPELCSAGPLTAESGDKGVELVLEDAERRRVAGRVVSRAGVPLEGVRVALGRSLPWQRSEERKASAWVGGAMLPPDASRLFLDDPVATTDAEGRFEIPRVVIVDGTFLNLSGAAILLGGHHRFDPDEALEELEIEVQARCEFRVVLDDWQEADAVSLVNEEGKLYPLFVRVEDKTISMPRVTISEGRSGVAQIGEGLHTLVLEKDGVEVRRFQAEFVPGGVQEVRP